MIIGIGTDLCDIRRIEKTLERFDQRFIDRIYDEYEVKKAMRRPNPAPSPAQSWAAKEACAKALGTGFRQGVFWRDMVVQKSAHGAALYAADGGRVGAFKFTDPQWLDCQGRRLSNR